MVPPDDRENPPVARMNVLTKSSLTTLELAESLLSCSPSEGDHCEEDENCDDAENAEEAVKVFDGQLITAMQVRRTDNVAGPNCTFPVLL
jgi:hypothetical protein